MSFAFCTDSSAVTVLLQADDPLPGTGSRPVFFSGFYDFPELNGFVDCSEGGWEIDQGGTDCSAASIFGAVYGGSAVVS